MKVIKKVGMISSRDMILKMNNKTFYCQMFFIIDFLICKISDIKI